MRYKKLDLNLLGALRTLLAVKSVTRASERLHVTQPTMSSILAKLREHFGDPLIIQIGRKAELTPLAKSLLEPVNDVLLRIDATVANRGHFNPATAKRHFTLVAPEYISIFVLSGAMQRLSQTAPGITLSVQIPIGVPADELESGHIDFVVTLEPFASPTHPRAPLTEDIDMVLADAHNQKIGAILSVDEYFAQRHVLFQGPQRGLTTFGNWYEHRYQRNRNIEIICDTHYAVPHFVQGTDRITMLPSRIARQYAATLPLRLVTPEFEVRRTLSVLQWHKYREDDPGSCWFREQLVASANAAPPIQIAGKQSRSGKRKATRK